MSIAANVVALQEVIKALPHPEWAAADRHLKAIFDEHRALARYYEELHEEHEALLTNMRNLREDAFAAVGRGHRTADDIRHELADSPI